MPQACWARTPSARSSSRRTQSSRRRSRTARSWPWTSRPGSSRGELRERRARLGPTARPGRKAHLGRPLVLLIRAATCRLPVAGSFLVRTLNVTLPTSGNLLAMGRVRSSHHLRRQLVCRGVWALRRRQSNTGFRSSSARCSQHDERLGQHCRLRHRAGPRCWAARGDDASGRRRHLVRHQFPRLPADHCHARRIGVWRGRRERGVERRQDVDRPPVAIKSQVLRATRAWPGPGLAP